MLQELLAKSELALAQLDGIAFGAGPGSFTGLRIACGVAQGLAFGSNLPVIGISTLEALAQQSKGCNRVISAIDARMGEIYHAAYIKSVDSWENVSVPILCLPQYAPLMSGDDWIGCGNAFDKYSNELKNRYGSSISSFKNGLVPHAREMAQLADKGFKNGHGINPEDAAPIYIRNKIALKENER